MISDPESPQGVVFHVECHDPSPEVAAQFARFLAANLVETFGPSAVAVFLSSMISALTGSHAAMAGIPATRALLEQLTGTLDGLEAEGRASLPAGTSRPN